MSETNKTWTIFTYKIQIPLIGSLIQVSPKTTRQGEQTGNLAQILVIGCRRALKVIDFDKF